MPDMPSCKPAAGSDVDLWCAHLPGDDVIPTVDKEAADQISADVNKILRLIWVGSPYDVKPTAHACRWPWGVEAWSESAVTFDGWKQQEDAS